MKGPAIPGQINAEQVLTIMVVLILLTLSLVQAAELEIRKAR